MKKIFEQYISWLRHPLFAGSMVLFVGNMVANLGSYFYHLLMGRMLGPASYGTLESLISLVYLLGIPMGTLNLVTVKFVASFKGQKNFPAIKSMLQKFTQNFFLFGGGSLVIYLALTPQITSFLHLSSNLPLITIGAISFVGLFTTINRGFLQGLLHFGPLAVSVTIESGLKLFLAVVFVWWGFSVNGAISSLLIGGMVAFIFTRFFLRNILKDINKNGDFNHLEMINYALPVFFSTLAFTSLYTTDIILARHFLPAEQAGFYAALSVLGKIIFFVTGPVVMVMFPLISERHTNGKKYHHLLFLSLCLVMFICLGAILIYGLFPQLMIGVLFGRDYLAASSYLFLFGLFLSFYSLSFLLTNFYLSIGKVKIVILPILAAMSQVIVIYLFHQTLVQMVWISVVITALLFATQMLYYLYGAGGKKTSFSYSSSV